MEEHREGRGLANPPGVLGVLGNEARWQIYVPLPIPPLLCAHDKVPPSPPSHLLEMPLHVRMEQASGDGMKMGTNANENWALAFCLVSQWLFPSFPCSSPYPRPIPLPLSHLSRQSNSPSLTSSAPNQPYLAALDNTLHPLHTHLDVQYVPLLFSPASLIFIGSYCLRSHD